MYSLVWGLDWEPSASSTGWENLTLHWEKLCKRQDYLLQAQLGNTWQRGRGGKTLLHTWGFEHDLGLSHNEEHLTFNHLEKQARIQTGSKKAFFSFKNFYKPGKARVKLYFSGSTYLHKIACFCKCFKTFLVFPHTTPMLTTTHTADSCRKWGEANLICIFHTLLVEGWIFAFKLCIYIYT